MESGTPWQDEKLPRFKSLTADTRCDVVVVGAGITGLTAAYLLTKAGKSVCVVEKGKICSGDTACTTAHLTYVTDMQLHELVRNFGRDQARLVWQGGAAAVNSIERIAAAEGIDCEFQRIPGFLHASLVEDRDERDTLRKDAELARELMFDATYLESAPYVGKPGIRFSNQAMFHPLKYLAGLAECLRRDGCRIFEQTEATEFSEDPRRIKAGEHHIRYEYLVIATHVPLMGNTGLISATMFQSKLTPYSTYAIGGKIPHGNWDEGSFWDTTDPYYYLRIDRGSAEDYAIFGGEDHKTGQDPDAAKRFDRLANELRKLIPTVKLDLQWSGQVIETHDGLPYIGEIAEAQFIGTGYSGNGITFGTLAGMMACDAVQGRKNPWQDLFAVNRRSLSGAWDYVKENFDYPYYLLRDRLAGAEAATTDEVPNGGGKVLRVNGDLVACSKDDKGKITAVSAICTHMGCVVHWNNAESTWDCPCHGSRFDPTGEVRGGPAETPLKEVPVPKSAQNGIGTKKKKTENSPAETL